MIGKLDEWDNYYWVRDETIAGGHTAVFSDCHGGAHRSIYVRATTGGRVMTPLTIDEAKQLHQALGEAIAHAEQRR